MAAVHYASSFLDTATLGGNIFKVLMSAQTALLWKQDRLMSGLCMWCLFFVLILCIDGFVWEISWLLIQKFAHARDRQTDSTCSGPAVVVQRTATRGSALHRPYC